MDVHRVIDSKIGRGIDVRSPAWISLSRKVLHLEQWHDYRPNDSDSWGYMTNKVWDEKTKSIMSARSRKQIVSVLWTLLENKSSYTGSNTRNERYLEYEWNGHQFSKKQKQALDKSLKTVSKHCEERHTWSITALDGKIARSACSMWLTLR